MAGVALSFSPLLVSSSSFSLSSLDASRASVCQPNRGNLEPLSTKSQKQTNQPTPTPRTDVLPKWDRFWLLISTQCPDLSPCIWVTEPMSDRRMEAEEAFARRTP